MAHVTIGSLDVLDPSGLYTLHMEAGQMKLVKYCASFLQKPRDLPFLFSVRLSATFGSLSSPDCTQSTMVRAWSDQGAYCSNPEVILGQFRTTP